MPYSPQWYIKMLTGPDSINADISDRYEMQDQYSILGKGTEVSFSCQLCPNISGTHAVSTG
jgi:hypothetical protein